MRSKCFVAVVARGGVIQAVDVQDSRKDAEKIAIAWGDSGFEDGDDDIKVFDSRGRVVFDFGQWEEIGR